MAFAKMAIKVGMLRVELKSFLMNPNAPPNVQKMNTDINLFTFSYLTVNKMRAGDDPGNADVMLGHHREMRYSFHSQAGGFVSMKVEDVGVVWLLFPSLLAAACFAFLFESRPIWFPHVKKGVGLVGKMVILPFQYLRHAAILVIIAGLRKQTQRKSSIRIVRVIPADTN